MTFLPDGTGAFDGPMRMPTTWRVDGDRLCVRMTLLPKPKCVALRRTDAGFEAYEGAKLDFPPFPLSAFLHTLPAAHARP